MKLCQSCQIKYPSHTVNCTTGNCGALLIPIPELDPGTRVSNKFRILRTLGTGGFGTVYLAQQVLNPTAPKRALKFPNSDAVRDHRRFTRFQQEAALNLNHPNIVHVYDLEQANDGSFFFPMEYVRGCELRAILKEGPLRVHRALAIARGVAEGLDAAHARRIIHRDIKPENILVAFPGTRSETPKLLDFGIAAFKESSTGVSTSGGPGLSPPYAAPEQWRGLRGEQLDGRTDLYALGGVLFEMLTGRTPFEADEYSEWGWQHKNAPRIAPSQFRPELAQWPGLDDLVLRTLAVNRDDRPESVKDFLYHLAAVQHAGPPDTYIAPDDLPEEDEEPDFKPAIDSIYQTGPNRGGTVVIPTHPNRTETVVIPTIPKLPLPSSLPSEPPQLTLGGNTTVESRPDRKPVVLAVSIVAVIALLCGIGYYAFERSESPSSISDAASPPSSGATPTVAPAVKPATTANHPKKDESQSKPPALAALTVSCDLACTWKLDNVPQGRIEAGGSKRVDLSIGVHQVEASAADQHLEPMRKAVNANALFINEASFRFSPGISQRAADLAQQGDAKYKTGDNCGAISAYNEALRINPSYQPALNGRAEAQKEQKILGPCDNAN